MQGIQSARLYVRFLFIGKFVLWNKKPCGRMHSFARGTKAVFRKNWFAMCAKHTFVLETVA
ncbi:hypothetical protein ANACAC_03240 [Anaerostipes caccae L1-92]|uniref:Uncharacterized protein n=1 Tax=Anaerostipes caccae (strain DSM 14662 / CCUG 47493 / JCM 13470 / NCIMB 13811 / L1-92) TaxID=411490 RepID=B0MH03_ANACD|nr:hypothetical protein ANACAC_03240 [Anaerostipes caccae L1-92]